MGSGSFVVDEGVASHTFLFCFIEMHMLFGVPPYCGRLFVAFLHVGSSMWIASVAKCLLCCLGIVCSLRSKGVLLAKRCLFGGCPCIGCTKIKICVFCAFVLPRAFQKWLGSLWLMWLLETHLLTMHVILFFCLVLILVFGFLVDICEHKFWIVP